jgi:hypothetical protein
MLALSIRSPQPLAKGGRGVYRRVGLDGVRCGGSPGGLPSTVPARNLTWASRP